ncbi:MAG: nucleoid-structuring protein H-NS [Cyclobacteriaceae bacterium]
MMKLIIVLTSRLPLYFLLVGLISVHACKNKKKIAEISDQQVVKEQIQEAIAEQPEEVKQEVAVEKDHSPSYDPVDQEAAGEIEDSMTEIRSASSFNLANQSIEETLSFFSSPDAPVLIIIYENGSEVDYDEPTTIEKYLNYLKDTKAKPADIVEIGRDSAGKIKELVLRKK